MYLFDWIISVGEKIGLSILYPFYSSVMSGDVRYFYLYILTGLGLSWIYRSQFLGTKGFYETLTDKKVWTSKSAINDYFILFINSFIVLFIISIVTQQFSGLSQWIVSLFRSLGVTGEVNDVTAVSAGLFLTLTLFLVKDFLRFFVHYLFHIFPVLWEFHKVHHSAEVLNFTTSERSHPVEILIFTLVSVTATAVINGLFFGFFGDQLTVATVVGANIFAFAGNLIGGALRHSPFALSYGKTLEHWLISPAMHHIHHSEEERHFDKNMGGALAIWDRMFGTWMPAEPKYQYRYGIGEETKDYHTLSGLYVQPFVKAAAVLGFGSAATPNNKEHDKKVAQSLTNGTSPLILVIAAAATFAVTFSLSSLASKSMAMKQGITKVGHSAKILPKPIEEAIAKDFADQQPSVFLEDLTFAELRYLLNRESNSVIIPTGGTEQNGWHMILGKHNYVVKHTAQRIAKAAGKMLVAPVMAYVPEGDIKRHSGHMAFAGTLSLPESVFEKVLESTALSLKQHGFKTIYLLGDSGGNQKSQSHVAEKLTRLWKGQGVRVVQLSAYYQDHKQDQTLLSLGETKQTIGTHAGIRDTSELLYVKPDGVKTNMLALLSGQSRDFNVSGYTGQAEKASSERGKLMVSLKVKAALKQIAAVRAGR